MGQTLSRSEAREVAFRIVFSGETTKDVLDMALDGKNICEPELKFVNKIWATVLEKQHEIDQKIESHLVGWTMNRISKTDLACLRLAVAEIIIGEVPPPVIINECVAISKKYGMDTSGSFVNGILAKIVG